MRTCQPPPSPCFHRCGPTPLAITSGWIDLPVRALALAVLAVALSAGEARPITLSRIGDAGSLPDPARYDERFPEMAEWAKAGVEGGIPTVERVVATVEPGADLQAAITGADAGPGRLGVVLLRAGTYAIDRTLTVKSGVVLRGVGRERTLLLGGLDGSDNRSPWGCGTPAIIAMSTWSALEDLTVANRHVRDLPEADYLGKYSNFSKLMTQNIQFGKSNNAWADRCAITHSGTNPLTISGNHVTLRDCVIERAFNKGSKGNGYLELNAAKYTLIYACSISEIRHISIMWKAQYAVIYGCRIGVDVNYHDGEPLQVLVEACDFAPRSNHHWGSISFGWPPWQKEGPGARNFLWANRGGGRDNPGIQVIKDTTGGYVKNPPSNPMILDFGPAPKHGTLYAVSGRHISAAEVEKEAVYAKLLAAHSARQTAAVVLYATTALAKFTAGEPQHTKAGELLAQAQVQADEALTKLRVKPTPAALRTFRAGYAGTTAAEAANGLAVELEAKAFATLGATPGVSALRTHLTNWRDLVPGTAAEAAYAQLAADDLARRRDSMKTPAALQAFTRQWVGTPAATDAEALLVAMLRERLDAVVAKKGSLSRKEREQVAAQFAGTPLEAQARSALVD